MLLGSGIGILDIVFMLALIGFALWKTTWVRIILSVCILIWGVFAMKYDAKIGVPLLAIGTVLLFMGILNRITESQKVRIE